MACLPSRPCLLVALAALLAAVGCASPRLYFRPAEEVLEVPGRGYLAVASYELADSGGARLGTIRIDSQGIYQATFDPAEGARTFLHLELSLQSRSGQELVVPLEEIAVVNLGGTPWLGPEHLYVEGQPAAAVRVPAGSSRQVDLLFRVPETIALEEVEDFLFHWHARSGSIEKVEFTHFLRMPPTSFYYPAFAYPGYWNGYFFPGHGQIPDWGLSIFFAPTLFPYYEEQEAEASGPRAPAQEAGVPAE